MKNGIMSRAMHPAAVLLPVLAAAAALTGCPGQPSYPSTITPIYAVAPSALWIYNGSSWASVSAATTTAGGTLTGVAVSGSGSGATIYVSGSLGVARFNGSSWGLVNTGLGNVNVTRLTSSAALYASTAGGLSMLNPDGSTWSNNAGVTPVDAFSFLPYTFVAVSGSPNLDQFNGTGLAGGFGTSYPGVGNLTSVWVDGLGDLIAGGATGMAVFYAGASAWVRPLSAVAVASVYGDPFGNAFAATASGLYVATSSTTSVSILSGAVNCVYVDGAGTIYAGTPTGLEISTNSGSTWSTRLAGQNIVAVTTTAPLYSW